MDDIQMRNLEAVYNKWKDRGPGGVGAGEKKVTSDFNSDAGKKAWEDKFGCNLKAPVRSSTDRRKRSKNKYVPRDEMPPLPPSKFQVTPPDLPVLSQRPFMGEGCTRCCPNSHESFFTVKPPQIGITNILNLDSFIKNNLFRRTICHISFANSRKMNYTLANISQEQILSKDRVKNAVLACAFKHKDAMNNSKVTSQEGAKLDLSTQEKDAQSIFGGMQAIVYKWLLRFSAWVLFKLFGQLLSNIQIQERQILMLQQAAKDKVPIVFLPLHKSHLDYILLTFVLVLQDIQIPYIAAGDNLNNIPVFSWLMRHLGAFFIKRKLDRQSGADVLYGSILQTYIEELLLQGQFMEIFIEGTRSRTGHGLFPKTGLLSTIVKSVTEGNVPDVYIVPVSITYEKIIEGSYSSQLLGQPKKPESFYQVMRGIYRTLTTHLGNVRVDLSQPFSLKEFLQSAQSIPTLQSFTSSVTSSADTSSSSSLTARNSSEISLSALDDQYYPIAKCLGTHVVHDCIKSTSLMTTHLVAFLLLTKHRQGVCIHDLIESLEWLKAEVISCGRDLGYSGSPRSAVYRGIKYLGKCVLLYEDKQDSAEDSMLYVKPNLATPHILDLCYYSNQVISLFLLDAVVASSIQSVMETNSQLSERFISRDQVIRQAMNLCQFLAREFVFVPPCVNLKTELLDVLESFVAKGILITGERGSVFSTSQKRSWASTIAVVASWEDGVEEDWDEDIEYDQEYKVDDTDRSCETLSFLSSVLTPRIESYWLAAGALLWLIKQDISERDFVQSLHTYVKERVQSGVTIHSETCSVEPLKNAVKMFKDLGIIVESTDGKNMLQLSSEFTTEEEILKTIHSIGGFRS